MAKRPDFQQLQYDFAAHIRDPKRNARPEGVEDRRMAIYRNLFFKNVRGFLNSGFPVLRRLYDEAAWERMARDFFSRHQSRSPYFLEITREFLDYLENERTPQLEDPPFLQELAHYEWVELALSISDKEPDWNAIDAEGDLLEGQPVLSPLAWLLSYRYPVHKIGPDYRPGTPDEQPTQLLVYRDRNDKVGFMHVNPVTARLIGLLREQPTRTGRQQLATIAREMRHTKPEMVLQGGRQTLQQLHGAGVVLGVQK